MTTASSSPEAAPSKAFTPEQPEVSFVVIAYNEEATIERSLTAMLEQRDVSSSEVVVVDDGSTDRTAETVEKLAAIDPRLRFVRLVANKGRGHARHVGLSQADGRLIAMIDSDVIVPPDWVSRARSRLDGRDAVGGIAVPDGDATYIARRFGLDPKPRPPTLTISGNNGLYMRHVFESARVDPLLTEGEDIALVKAMDAAGLRAELIPELISAHCESKDFAATVRWFYQSGKGAARQWHRYHQLRLADLAFVTHASFTFAGAAAVLSRRPRLGCLLPLVGGGAVAWAHLATRFHLHRSRPAAVAGAAGANLALCFAYLTGRLVGHASRSGFR